MPCEESNTIRTSAHGSWQSGSVPPLPSRPASSGWFRSPGPRWSQTRISAIVESINDVDVAVVEDFEDLKALLKGVVTELCSPSLAIRKFVQTADSTNYIPGEDWAITVDPGVAGDFTWIQPDVRRYGPGDRRHRSERLRQLPVGAGPTDQNSNAVITEELARRLRGRTRFL